VNDHITVTERVFVAAPPERVWDYTQDYARRCEWDANVLEAEPLATTGPPRVRLRLRGGVSCVFQYRVFERPRRTGLAMVEVRSWLVRGGGGSWTYEARDGGTWWTQTNTITVRSRFARWCLGALLRWQLARATRRAMAKAGRILEAAEPVRQRAHPPTA
jgi:hypothetical protein